MRSERVRLFGIDSDPATAALLTRLSAKTRGIVFCGFAPDLERALQIIRLARANLAVVEIALDATDDLRLIREIRSRHESIAVVVYSRLPESEYAERALRAGAFGYVSKSASEQQLLEAIRAARGSEVYFSQRAMGRMLTRMVVNGKNRALSRLTEREQTVFDLLGAQIAIPKIAEELGLQHKTIEIYRRRIKDKLGFRSVSDLQKYALECRSGSDAFGRRVPLPGSSTSKVGS